MNEDPGLGTPSSPPPPPQAGGATPGAPTPPPPPTPQPAPAPTVQPAPGWGSVHDPSPATVGWGPASPSAAAGWDRPSSGSNGCLKGCLIIGGIVAVLGVIGIAALITVGGRIAQDIAENPDAVFGGECPYVTAGEVGDAIGDDAQVFLLEGFADGTMGTVFDKRLLPDATDCYFLSPGGMTGRIAVQDGGGAAAFQAAKTEAQDFTARELDDLGDEAFCTTIDNAGFGGAFVRFGERVAYVSVLEQALDEGNACAVARSIARSLEP